MVETSKVKRYTNGTIKIELQLYKQIEFLHVCSSHIRFKSLDLGIENASLDKRMRFLLKLINSRGI